MDVSNFQRQLIYEYDFTLIKSSSHSFSLSKYSHLPSFSTATKDYLNRLREHLHFYAVAEIRFLMTKNDVTWTLGMK
ncbi:22087_t:CDS:2 [Rhizophagus irregularis]|nr:22087_t:CDS:2 [Rhizophagus irregularis]